MNYTFEAQFGDFKITAQQVSISESPTEENELYVLIIDPTIESKNFFESKNIFDSPPFPKGKACVREYIKIPPKCPNCHQRLPENFGLNELQEIDSTVYLGVTATLIPSYEENILELKLHYETMEYKTCYPNEKNLINS